jgi:membrane protease subunit HflK
MLYLPLDKLISQAAANDAAVGSRSGVQMQQAQPQQQQQAAPAQDVTQSYESVRQRDARGRDSSRERESR